MRDAVLSVTSPLEFVWETLDPFLFCVHHEDAYPAGNAALGPAVTLAGRDLGQDFAGKDGWRMYHGDVVPGFPQHPHRGFETITVVRRGLVDHFDSLGAVARYGEGDVQWMTAGSGIVHSEMFPLVHRDRPNPTELFQIWLNLPRRNKLVPPHFSMFWSHTLPRHTFRDDAGRATEVCLIAGSLPGVPEPPRPPPSSWAANPEANVAIWTVKLAPHAEWTLPPAPPRSNRMLYLFAGDGVRIAGQPVTPPSGVRLHPEAEVPIVNGGEDCELLLLQGRPLDEPVAHYGPFVMTTRAELEQAFDDYRRTGFGGWPWPSDAPVHPGEQGRFAVEIDGRESTPGG